MVTQFSAGIAIIEMALDVDAVRKALNRVRASA
jgi:hypothetical protein